LNGNLKRSSCDRFNFMYFYACSNTQNMERYQNRRSIIIGISDFASNLLTK
jgi:hypothetical protein